MPYLADWRFFMEKKICRICGCEFESEIEGAEVCPGCEGKDEAQSDEITLDDIEAAKDEISADDISGDGDALDEESVLKDSESGADDSAEGVDGEDVYGGDEGGDDSHSEELLAIMEEARKKKEKQVRTIAITVGSVAAAAVLISAVLFIPFKKNDAINRTATTISADDKKTVISQRTNLYNSICEAIEFAKHPDAAMVIGGETIDKSLFDYFYERAQYNLLMENGLGSAQSNDEINKFWDSAENVKKAQTNAKTDLITFVVSKQMAVKEGITLTDEEQKSIDQYIESYVTDEFLKQMKLSKEQVKYILEGSTLTSKLAQQVVAKEEKYNISNDQVTAYVKKTGDKITAKHILFNTLDTQTYQPLSDDKKAEVKKKAQETLDKIKGGADFDALMNELSEDPGLKSYPDGYTFGKGEMVEGFEKAAFALGENEVSDLVETDFGIHIIKRVPLVLSDSDVQNSKAQIQNDMFEDEILTRAKDVKILTNNTLINAAKPTTYETQTGSNAQ